MSRLMAISFGMLLSLNSSLLQAEAAGIGAQRQAELRHLLLQDCGSCHGLTLKGGLGPALTPEALRDKPKAAMLATLLYGRPGTPMPPWSTMLTDTEAQWLIDLLYQGVNK